VLTLHQTPLSAASAETPVYEVYEYASIKDYGTSVVIRNINSFREVAGGFKRGNPQKHSQAFILTENGFEDIPNDPGTDFSTSYDLNDRNEVVGAANTLTALRPFRYSRQQGSPQLLTLLPGNTGGIAYAINDQGEAAGYSSGENGQQAVWWSRGNEVSLLPGLSESNSRALGINDNGDIVGSSTTDFNHAVIWPNKGQVIDLGTLPGFTGSEALSISNNGNIAGSATGTQADPNFSRAVLWKWNKQTVLDLGALEEGGDSRATDVNDRGQVVGASSSGHGGSAFIWTADEGMRDLNSLIGLPGIVLTEALSINRQGDILAMGHKQEESDHSGTHNHQDHERPRQIYVLRARP
jgi:probable HAF family extracellular repeat protein